MTNRSKLQEANFKAGNTEILKRGLVKEMGDFAAKRSTVNFQAFADEFLGRQFSGTKVTRYQLRRHMSWMKSHGVLKAAAKARSAKAGAQ
jgi:hypothetical protein